MLLRTLGGLELSGCSFTRLKPLVLLSYLALEGVCERRLLAELFWPEAADRLNSLSRALSQLRKGAPGAVDADELRVWTTVPCDAVAFLQACELRDHSAALAHYRGPFLHGVRLSEPGVELEEWLYSTRERLAARAQAAMLQLAEAQALSGRWTEAASLAERAYTLAGAPEPEMLPRYYALLVAGDHPFREVVRQEAASYGIALALSQAEALARLQSTPIGRQRERARLEALAEGQWAWLGGAAGMGKTTLLKSLTGLYLPARSGLPYATLEPLLGESIAEGELRMLRRLSQQRGSWLIDDWERCDRESQALLVRLRDLRPQLRVIIAGRERPPLPFDLALELGPLPPEELADPALWQQTGGLPALIAAHGRGEPLAAALERGLSELPEAARRVYLALSLLDHPELPLVRRALKLSATDMAQALELLIRAGLSEPSGAPRATAAARDYLAQQPLLEGELALALARQLEGAAAYPFYQRGRLLWEASDEAAISASYRAWVQELLRRGFPQRALESLQGAPDTPELRLLKARALERAGRFQEALAALTGLPESAAVLALKGTLLWRLGQPEAAQAASKRALSGELEVRAEALSTLAHLARSRGDYPEAIALTKRAVALWQSLGQRERWADGLNNLAVALALAGMAAEAAFAEALSVAEDYQLLKARILLNQGVMHERAGRLEAAKNAYREAIVLAEQLGGNEIAANAWNNLGVIYHKVGELAAAKGAYEMALERARLAGERRMLGMFMANYAELTENFEAWNEALQILEAAGHAEEAAQYRAELPADHPFRHACS